MIEPARVDADTTLQAIRAQRPLVHCLTNDVTIGHVADALAALGALPVMASAPEEAADMVEHAQALVLNLGTPTPARWAAARTAADRARQRGTPVVLDPVGCGATPWRTEQARALVRSCGADVVRGNVPEVAALAGLKLVGVTLRGVTAVDTNSTDAAGAVEALARAASRALGSTVVITGRADTVSDGDTVQRHTTDVPLLARVVGAGDILSAMIGACCAVEANRPAACAAGLQLFARAAHAAAGASAGPGSFWAHFLDALYALAPEALAG